MSDDLTDAAVARLREYLALPRHLWTPVDEDTALVLAALEAAQVEARRATETLTQIRDSTYRNATTLRVIAARALDAAMKGEGGA